MRSSLAGVVALALCTASLPAAADPPTARVVQLKPVDIVGRRCAPLASIEVSKATESVPLSDLRQPFAARIDQTVQSPSL